MIPTTETAGPTGSKRSLAAVAFADVVNYSAMMAADETRTHDAVMALLDGVVRPKATLYGGRVVKSTGDGVLAQFGSALNAVEWAEELQRTVQQGIGTGDAPRLQLRISIHLGDIITTQNDIYGDGVNVAARLLEHAVPDGIVMSEAVHDIVRGSMGGRAVDLGLRGLKSFARPVRVYALGPDRPGMSRPPAPAGSVPTIAVLPLHNLGDNPEDDYFAEGVVEDIIVSLAGLGELMVVSRASTLGFQGRRVDPREVSRALGVRYVVTGSVRRSERLIRVGMQLCEAESGRTIWSELAEAAPGELFDMQDRIVGKIVAGIAPNVRSSELRKAMRKQPESFSAYDHTLRALHLVFSFGEKDFAAARECLEAAIREDPSFAMPHAWLAWWHMLYIGQGRSPNPDHDMERAGYHAQQAIQLDGNNALALAIQGHVKSYLFHQYDLAVIYLDRALKASPSSAAAWVFSAATLAYIGEGRRAVEHAEHALRLSPLDRGMFFIHNILALAHYANGTYADAITWCRLADQENPYFTANLRVLIGSLVASGQVDEAREV
ncbi:MAG TPA: tetratricopeptide repeat protein, partial [Acetobacteraceae bacterium]|nr:tetratricopeptide repeat protein [Acetobacteraceae bacterium]